MKASAAAIVEKWAEAKEPFENDTGFDEVYNPFYRNAQDFRYKFWKAVLDTLKPEWATFLYGELSAATAEDSDWLPEPAYSIIGRGSATMPYIFSDAWQPSTTEEWGSSTVLTLGPIHSLTEYRVRI